MSWVSAFLLCYISTCLYDVFDFDIDGFNSINTEFNSKLIDSNAYMSSIKAYFDDNNVYKKGVCSFV